MRDRATILLHLGAALVVATLLTPLVRSVTAGLDETVGQAWPFSMTRCHASATPGCEGGFATR